MGLKIKSLAKKKCWKIICNT